MAPTVIGIGVPASVRGFVFVLAFDKGGEGFAVDWQSPGVILGTLLP